MNITLSDLKQILDVHQLDSKEYYDENGLPLRLYHSPTRQLDEKREKQILTWNGIENTYFHEKAKKKYRMFICQSSCFALFQLSNKGSGQPLLNSDLKQKNKWFRMDVNTSSREINRVIRLATRALYVLGYDIGMIEISVFHNDPKYYVTKLSNKPLLLKKYEHLLSHEYEKAVQQNKKEMANIPGDPLLGADIEFVLRHVNGKYILASKYFSKHGKVGYDSIWLRGSRNKHPIAELRPQASKDPRNLVGNIYRCMQMAIRKINNSHIEWLAGGQPLKTYPIGGHIHFSQVPLNMKLIRSLDNYLTLPLFLLESKESMNRRPKYGFIGDYREQFHGGFEYRTPPSWIISPTITKGVLSLAKVIASNFKQLTWMPLNRFEVQEAFFQGDQDKIDPIVKKLWVELKKCAAYSDHKQYLDAFYYLIEKREIWNEYTDIRKAWRLPPFQHTS